MSNASLFRTLVLLGEWTLQITVILGLAWLLVRLVRRSAALRHLVWLTAFSMILLLPILSRPQPLAHLRLQVSLQASSPVGPPSSSPHRQSLLAVATPQRPALPVLSTPRRVDADRVIPSRDQRSLILGGLFALWCAGIAVIAFQGVYASWYLRLLRQHSAPVAFSDIDLEELAARVGLNRTWELRISRIPGTPSSALTWGFLRPVVLLPADAATWSKARREMVLLHELAHVQRGDSLTQMLAAAVCAVCWFHPLVWSSARALRTESEAAADDTVLRTGILPSAYAMELLQVAAELGAKRGTASLISVPLMGQSALEVRVRSIVGSCYCRRGLTRSALTVAAGAGFFLMLVCASLRTDVVVAPHRGAALTGMTVALQTSNSPAGTRPGLRNALGRLVQHRWTEERIYRAKVACRAAKRRLPVQAKRFLRQLPLPLTAS